MLLTAILAYLHVLSAMAWLGGGLFFAFLIAPHFSRLTPSGSRELFITVIPGVIRFFQIIAGVTVLFGFLLLYNMTGGDFSQVTFSTTWGAALSLGMTTAVAAFVVSEALAVPGMRRMVELHQKSDPGSAAPPAGLLRAARWAGLTALLTIALLLLTLAFMITAGFY